VRRSAVISYTHLNLCIDIQKKIGSRKILLFGLVAVVLGMALLTASTVTSSAAEGMAYVAVASVALSMFGIGVGPGTCISGYPSEVTTQVTRPNAQWMGGISFWFSSSAVFVIP